MNFSINRNDLPNKFDVDPKVYDYLVKEFLKLLKDDYEKYLLSSYDIPIGIANELVRIHSNPNKYTVGIDSPNDYISKELKTYSNEILSREYGSVSKGYMSKPVVRKYCESMDKLSRVIWIKYLHDVIL